MFLNSVTVKTKISPLFISQIPRVNLAEVGSNTVRDVKQRILLVDLGECFGYNHQMAPVEHNHQMAPVCMYVCITFISDSAIQNIIVIQCWGP